MRELPTFIEFGKKSEEKVAQLIKAQNGKKVLIHYGGHSAKKSGLIDKIEKLLTEENIPYVFILGEDELAQNNISVKNMKEKKQDIIGIDNIIENFEKIK